MASCASCALFSAVARECRALPPQPVMVQGPNGQPAILGVFPATTDDRWCGAHRPLPKE